MGKSVLLDIRKHLGIDKASPTWEHLVREFRRWHRDPAHPERQYQTRTSPGFISEVSGAAAGLAARFLTSANNELDPDSPKWPQDSEKILNQLYRLAGYEGSENKRARLRTAASTQRVNSSVDDPATTLSPPQPAHGFSSGNIESSPNTPDAAARNEGSINVPARASPALSAEHYGMREQSPALIESGLRTHASVDEAYAEAAEVFDGVESYRGNLDPSLQAFQPILNEYQVANTTLLVGISTISYAKRIPFQKTTTANALKTAVLDSWFLEVANTDRIAVVTVRYPWLSKWYIEFVLGDDEAYQHMQRQILGCPGWGMHNGTCMVEVNIMIKEEQQEVKNVAAEINRM